ncbi:MAG: hypothetical protein JRI76_00800 [Deltaproteobacteria bacterium]|nr:hypothetical protein [Deltaproteobacteria bacterium]MBW1954695.1 hypothetical protein [Deltaproteobacteria bacterium]MBW2040546.1 hypothetical protein [Deltaproteobacteria bacterium]MBW2131413.1 hypothetical protein [Deltaproteobacteria bacterium]
MNRESEDAQRRKRSIFDSMSEKRRQYILKRGYEKWDPFEEPKDPIDIRRDRTRRTTAMLVKEFLQTRSPETYSNAYGQGVLDMALGIINGDDRYLGMYEFSLWYRELLEKETRR